MVAVVKEDVGTEVQDFRKRAWPEGDIFIDPDMSFYKSLFDGQVKKETLWGFLWKMFVGRSEVSKRMRLNSEKAAAHKADSNLKGEGLILGGLYIVRKGGPAEYGFAESEVMDYAPVEEVLEAAKRAAGDTGTAPAAA